MVTFKEGPREEDAAHEKFARPSGLAWTPVGSLIAASLMSNARVSEDEKAALRNVRPSRVFPKSLKKTEA